MLDIAVGTTYSLDFLALMTAPLAFAAFDREMPDGSLASDPVSMLQAVREHAKRITVFTQAGQIAVPPPGQDLLVFLEGSVYPVVPPDAEAIFHPKVWLLRFRDLDTGTVTIRFLCLSRNLTFDRSWDTVLRLDGTPGATVRYPELAGFTEALVTIAEPVHPVPGERARAIRDLGEDFARANWALPEGFDTVRFWPLGHDGHEYHPFEGQIDRLLVVSPFLTSHAVAMLTKKRRGSILLSRPESFDRVGRRAVRHLAECLILSGDVTASPATGEANVATSEAAAVNVVDGLSGLHAKAYVADAGWRGRVWTGSANATDAAFAGNVEFLVELEGKKKHCGVDAAIGDRKDRIGLRNLVEPYQPTQDDDLALTPDEILQRDLDRLRRAIGGMRFVATCRSASGDDWIVVLTGTQTVTRLDPNALAGGAVTIRPITHPRGTDAIPEFKDGLSATFRTLSAHVTPYFAVTIAVGEIAARFVVVAELVGGPEGRAENVLSGILNDKSKLLRFLLLLLGDLDAALEGISGSAASGLGAGVWESGSTSNALLEPLVRAYAREPDRLRDIARVVEDLKRAGHGDVLPDDWNEVWDPIAEALAEGTAR
jgi:hypothetical protein